MQENVSNHNYNPQDPDIVQRVNHYYNENACNHNVSTISPHDISILMYLLISYDLMRLLVLMVLLQSISRMVNARFYLNF